MSILKTIIQGESLTIGFRLNPEYDTARMSHFYVHIGKELMVATLVSGIIRMELSGATTARYYGIEKLYITIDDTTFGVRKTNVGTLDFVEQDGILSTLSTNSGYSLIVGLTVSDLATVVDTVLLEAMGFDAYLAGFDVLKDAAALSAANAKVSEDNAKESETQALTSKNYASGYADAASADRVLAQTAKTGAETAQGITEAAEAQTLLYRDAAASMVTFGPAMPPYADLDALILANPDHTRTHLSIADGNWNYWNGATFVAGGAYQTALGIEQTVSTSLVNVPSGNAVTSLVDGIVNVSNLKVENSAQIETVSANMFDYSNVIQDYIAYGDNAFIGKTFLALLQSNAGKYNSGIMKIKSGTDYSIWFSNLNPLVVNLCYYDINLKLVRFESAASFTPESGEEYYSFWTVDGFPMTNIMIVEGILVPSIFVTFNPSYKIDNLRILNENDLLPSIENNSTSKNKFNKLNIVTNTTIAEYVGGDVIYSPTDSTTGFIPCLIRTNYKCVGFPYVPTVVILFDKNKTYLGFNYTSAPDDFSFATTVQGDATADAEFMRFVVSKSGVPNLDNAMVLLQYDYSEGMTFIPYAYNLDAIKNPFSRNYLREKTIMLIGDSISALTLSYPRFLKYELETIKDFVNLSHVSATIQDYVDTPTYDGVTFEGSLNVLGNQVKEVLDSTIEEPELIFLFGGMNDIVVNPATLLSEVALQVVMDTDIDLVDRTTVQGAMRWHVEKLHSKYPNSKIVIISNYQAGKLMQGGYLNKKTMRDCIEQIANRLSVNFVDLFFDLGIYSNYELSTYEDLDQGIYLHDGVHLNVAGAKFLASYLARRIENILLIKVIG